MTDNRIKLNPDDAYLSYHDVRLTKEDVDTLRDDWLTDNCIAFWEEYLEREKLSQFPKSKIVLLRPSMSFMLTHTDDPLTLKSALPDFTNTTHIFLPINDCRNVEVAEGGSHWSLLLVSILDQVAFHYDSLSPSNLHDAQIAVRKIEQLLGKQLKFTNLTDSPQQENGSDCGVYVCMEMRYLLMKKLLTANSNNKISMSMSGRPVDAHAGRKEMLKIIDDFRKEGARRKSSVIPSISPCASHNAGSRADRAMRRQQHKSLQQQDGPLKKPTADRLNRPIASERATRGFRKDYLNRTCMVLMAILLFACMAYVQQAAFKDAGEVAH